MQARQIETPSPAGVSGSHFDRFGEARVVSRAPARERWSWALYDFANTIFSMNIATMYFAVWMIEDLGSSNTM